MTGYYCDWCRAQIVREEDMISISLSKVVRKPKRWGAIKKYFAGGEEEVTLHTSCFVRHAQKIADHLYPDGTPPPKKRTLDAEFPMWDELKY